MFHGAVRDAVLVISELLSNAILHAYPLPGERLQVAWAVENSSVEVAVSDGGSATVPHPGHPSPSSVGGRGLSIVEHLCQTWGIRADEVGLTVWAVVSAPRHNGSGATDTAPVLLSQPRQWRSAIFLAPHRHSRLPAQGRFVTKAAFCDAAPAHPGLE